MDKSAPPLSRPGFWQSFVSQPIGLVLGMVLLFTITFFNDANFRHSDADRLGPDWQTLMKLGICLAAGLYACFYLGRVGWAKRRLSSMWIFGFAAWAALCTVKSLNPVYSLAAWLVFCCTLMFAVATLKVLGRRRILLVSLSALTAFLIGCWVMHFVAFEINGFDPALHHARNVKRLAGLVHPNGTARLAVLTIVLILAGADKGVLSRRLGGPLLVFAAITLLATGSRTWLLASLAVGALFLWRQLSVRGRALMAVSTVLALTLLALGVANFYDASKVDKKVAKISRSGNADEIYSMTGRVDLWEFCLEKVGDSPLLGFGYGCQRMVIEDHFWQTQHAHNLWINVMLGTGVVGCVGLLAVFVSQLLRLFRQPDPFPDLMLVMLLVGGMAENPILNPISGSTTLLFLISLFWRD
ncbi:MAG: O-antigen ligase family protein [Pirellulales bacterium]|nr:O-antigen ligase family protein [Pirellulales bacterium]